MHKDIDGLIVDFDGEKNVVMYKGLKEYSIGGMIAEYAKLKPVKIKDILLEFEDLDKPVSDEVLGPFFPWFIDKLEDEFGTVPAIMITIEFLDLIVDVFKMNDEEKAEFFNEEIKESEIAKFIFEDTQYDCLGMETVEHLLLTTYYWYAKIYVHFKYTFNLLTTEDGIKENDFNAFSSFYWDNIDFQHIDFKIACFDGDFRSLYTIKSSMSLIIFEAAQCLNKGMRFVKCANCGEYFVQEGRSDSIYCSYKSPQNPEKTCKEIGAQVTRANKEKNDIATKEYRKVYMKYKMATKRHPGNIELMRCFEQLTTDVKEWRKKLASGSVTTDEFLEWLKSFN